MMVALATTSGGLSGSQEGVFLWTLLAILQVYKLLETLLPGEGVGQCPIGRSRKNSPHLLPGEKSLTTYTPVGLPVGYI